MVVAFRNGEVKELKGKTGDDDEMVLEDYLNFEKKATRLPGTVVKIMRNRHSIQQPTYFTLRRDSD